MPGKGKPKGGKGGKGGGRNVRLSGSTAWYFASAIAFLLTAIAAVVADDGRQFIAKASTDVFPVRRIATKIVEGNPSPSIVLKVTSAKWCWPCRQLKPILAELKKDGYSVEVYDFDDDDNAPKPTDGYGLPYLRWEQFGEVAKEQDGYQERETLEETFAELEGSIFNE